MPDYKLIKSILLFAMIVLINGCGSADSSKEALIADHNVSRLSVLESIPDSAIK